MPDPKCSLPGCIHQPGFVIDCGYDLPLALASVGPGWAELVREGFASVSPLGRIVQVKKKFGQLRIYPEISPGTPPISSTGYTGRSTPSLLAPLQFVNSAELPDP